MTHSPIPLPSPPPSPPPSPLPLPPSVAWWLGGAGLLPFVAGALLVCGLRGGQQGPWAAALLAYGALIVSFLGGIHWGLAMRQAPPPTYLLVWGVVPSLLAWPMLWLSPAPGLLGLGAALWACYAVDHRVFPAQGIGAWLGLRRLLTGVASLSCWAAAAGVAF